MNSSIKRIFAVLLTAVMMISLLAGCGDKKTDTAGTGTQSSSGSYEKPNNAEHPNWLTEEKTTLSILTYDGVNNAFEAPNNDDPFWQWMEEQTNVHIEWEIVPYTGYNEIIQTRLASGDDLADIIQVYNVTNGQSAGENGILVDMAQYMDCLPYIQQYFEENPGYEPMIVNGAGQIYTINGVSEPVEGHALIMYNTDWMERLDLEIPTTLEEFEELLYIMYDAGDMNGNGKDDEIILSADAIKRINAVLGNAYGLESYYFWNAFQADENGQLWHEDTSDNMRALLSFENLLYEDGILDPEIASMSANKLSEKVAADRVGVFVYFSSFAMSYGGLTTKGQADPYGEHYTLGVPLASEWNNYEPYLVRWDSANSNPTGVNAKSKNIELAIRWLDFLFASKDAVMRRTLGIEGEDYRILDDGSVEYIYPTEEGEYWAGSGRNAGQLTLPYQQTKDQLLVTKYQYPWYLEQYANLRDNYNWITASVPRVNYYTEEEQEVIDTYKPDFLSYINEMQAKFISGEIDIDKDSEWNNFISNANKLGLPELTAAHQSLYDRLK